MRMTLLREWLAMDGKNGRAQALLQAGLFEVERVPNPRIPGGPDWLVIKGTLTGATEEFWRAWGDPSFGNLQVIIEE